MIVVPPQREKRLRIRARQRGTLEMCILFERFLEHKEKLDSDQVGQLEALFEETDQDIGLWLAGVEAAPRRHQAILSAIGRTLPEP
ncbi:MAG: succinate dehydrogenase assembly factor 2 [Rhodobacteraceae bacterium]|nr:succinate dehydrogenase assembly factor 2 [Paracoccaceae bacterium]